MIAHAEQIEVQTNGKGTYEITEKVRAAVTKAGATTGLAAVFVQHTSASVIVFENADDSARTDLDRYFEELVPEDTSYFTHTAEGQDDSTSHIRMVLTRTSEVIPVVRGKLALGTWQGIFLFEHRSSPHRRRVTISIIGT